MTPSIKTLTAVAALTLATTGAMAQDNRQTVPLAQPDAAAVTAPESGTTYVVNPDGTRQVLTAEGDATQADAATEPAATDATEAPADEAGATEAEPPSAETAQDEAEAVDPAEAAADEATGDEAAEPEATEAAADEATTEEPAADEATTEEAAEPEAADAAAEEAPADEAEATEAEAGDEAATEGEATEEATDEGATDEEATAEDEGDAVSAVVEEVPVTTHEQHIPDVAFSFEGPFGKYDQHQLQRGLQVYTEICAACHGLRYVPLRTLGDATGPGLPEDQVRAYAAEYSKVDPETGEDVPREPSDNFPYIPHQDGMGPDLSLMAKARAGFHGPYGTGISQLLNGIGGPEYIHAILTGYTGETKEEAGTTLYENTAFPGGWIAMPPPLDDESVEFQDGHPNDLDSISMEVSAFLMWTAEPKMMQRKQVGTVAVLFLVLLSVLLYLTNKRLWTPIKHPRKDS